MKYYIIAGEASGDLHASNLMKAISCKDAKAEYRVWGGDLMQEAGGQLVKHYNELAFMGFVEVVMNLRTVLKNISFCKKDILSYQPDVLILVDYPGFNLRIAEFVGKRGMKIVYYISPQIWAWKQSRVKKIKRDVDKMIVILPFEKDFYKKHGVEVDFVGHPLLDALADAGVNSRAEFLKKNRLNNKPIVALLPGSREMEVGKMLQVMLKMTDHFPDWQFVIAGVSSLSEGLYKNIIGKLPVKVLLNQTRNILYHTDAALVTSGTATLETALIGVPQVVCYKGNSLSFAIAKRIVKIKYISLVNLIMDRIVVAELIQNDLTEKNLAEELDKLLNNETIRNQMLDDYKELTIKLGSKGASKRASAIIEQFMAY